MNNTLSLIVATGVGFGIGFTVGRVSVNSEFPLISSTTSTLTNNESTNPTNTKSQGGVDHYEIQYLGSGQLFGSYSVRYSVLYPSKQRIPPTIRSFKSSLPHTLKFSLYKGATVSASGLSFDSKVKVRIFRNGNECGKVLIDSENAESSKVCPAD